MPAPDYAVAMNTAAPQQPWQHGDHLATCQPDAYYPAARCFSDGAFAPWQFHPPWLLPAIGSNGAGAQSTAGLPHSAPYPMDQQGYAWQFQSQPAWAAPAPVSALAPCLYSTGLHDLPVSGPGRGCNGTPFQPNLGNGGRVQAPAPEPSSSLGPAPVPLWMPGPQDAVAQAALLSAGLQCMHALPGDSFEQWRGSSVADAVSSWLTTPPFIANGQPPAPLQPAATGVADCGTATQAAALLEHGTQRASSPAVSIHENGGSPRCQDKGGSEARHSSEESEPPPPGIVMAPPPMQIHLAPPPTADAARGSSELQLPGLEKELAALVPYAESSMEAGCHSDRDSDGEQAHGGVLLCEIVGQSNCAADAGPSAAVPSPPRSLSGSQTAILQGNHGAGDDDVLTLASERDMATVAPCEAAGHAPTASADGLAQPGSAEDGSAVAPESPGARLDQRVSGGSPSRTSTSPTLDETLAARIAAIAAAAGPMLASAPATRLPPEAFAEAFSREGSPEPGTLAELPIDDAELDEAPEEETARDDGAADAGPAVLAAGAANRAKRTAGGDPMEVHVRKHVARPPHVTVLCRVTCTRCTRERTGCKCATVPSFYIFASFGVCPALARTHASQRLNVRLG